MIPKTITLQEDGVECPSIGYGTYKVTNEKCIEWALQAGYRHFDCAAIYSNEAMIGKALKKNLPKFSLERKDIWITSKLWNTDHSNVSKAIERTLKDLFPGDKKAYLDCYLIHWPFAFQESAPGSKITLKDENGVAVLDRNLFTKYSGDSAAFLRDCWKDMLNLKKEGLVRCVGVSNFSQKHLEDFKSHALPMPSINQFECHPFLPQFELVKWCQDNGIAVVAYSSLGTSNHCQKILGDVELKMIAAERGLSVSQFILSWQLERGIIVIPKSSTFERMKENLGVKESDDYGVLDSFSSKRGKMRFMNPVDIWKHDCFE